VAVWVRERHPQPAQAGTRLPGECGLLWLTGLNAPDHNTLWRFWRDHRAALRQVFTLVVRTAVEAELVGVVLHCH